jgi:hypothetical protein
MQPLEHLVALSIAMSVFGFLGLGLLTWLCLREVRHIGDIQRAIFLQLRRDGVDIQAGLAELKALLEE